MTETKYTVKEIRKWLECWLITGKPKQGVPLHNILQLLECDQDGIEACKKNKELE